MNTDKALKPGTVVVGGKHPFVIKDVLQADGQGFLYRATAQVKQANGSVKPFEIVVREHFMSLCSHRGADGLSVETPEDILPTVDTCLEAFRNASIERARIANQSPIIIDVIDCFAANNTFYYIVEFLDGETLEEYVEQHGPLSTEEAREILAPIYESVRFMHTNRAIHTNIHPGHIRFVTHNGKCVPILFSLYCMIHFDEHGDSLWSIPMNKCKDGYAPPEQYIAVKHFTPQIDIFALASLLVFCLSGKHLPDSRTLTEDIIRETLPDTVHPAIVSGLIHALNPDIEGRTVSVFAFLDEIKEFYTPPTAQKSRTDFSEQPSVDFKSSKRNVLDWRWIVGIIGLIAMIVGIICIF